MKQQVNRLVNEPDLIIYDKKNKKIKAYKNKDDADEESEEDEGELLDFDVMTEIIDSEKHAIKNLLMTSQIKRRNMAEVILKARKRMSIMNDFSDILSDELITNSHLLKLYTASISDGEMPDLMRLTKGIYRKIELLYGQ
jgi:hypothetical protein